MKNALIAALFVLGSLFINTVSFAEEAKEEVKDGEPVVCECGTDENGACLPCE